MQKNQGVTRHHSKLLASAAALRGPCTAGSAAAWNPNTLSARMPTMGAEHAATHTSTACQRCAAFTISEGASATAVASSRRWLALMVGADDYRHHALCETLMRTCNCAFE